MKLKPDWLTDKYIMLMLLVFPLWTGFKGYASLTFWKFIFFAAATGLWLLLLAVSLLVGRRSLTRPPLCRICALAFMGAAALSAVLSPYGSATIIGASRYDGLVTLLLYGCIFLGVSAFARPKKEYIYALAVSSLLCCAVAALQLMRVNALGLFPEGYDYYDAGVYYSGAFLGTIGNVDVLAAYFSLCIPLFIAVPVMSGERRDLLLFIPAAACLAILLVSGVASGALALVFAVLVGAPYLASARGGRRLSRALALCSVLAVAAGLCVVYFRPGSSGTLGELSQMLHGNIEDSFGSSRVLIWRETLSLVGERPLLGGGPDTLSLRTSLGFSRYVEASGVTLSSRVDNAHNEFLGYLVNIGALGLAAYLSVVVCSLVRVIKKRRADPLIPALGCALVCYLAQSFFGLGLCLVVPILWIIMGLICSDKEI